MNWDFLTPATDPRAGGNLGALATTIVTYILYVAGILAIAYLIYSGIIYITAGGNPDNAKKGQQGVINAVIGIIIITLAYFIARTAYNVGLGIGTGAR